MRRNRQKVDKADGRPWVGSARNVSSHLTIEIPARLGFPNSFTEEGGKNGEDGGEARGRG